jgi:hypothetical protein
VLAGPKGTVVRVDAYYAARRVDHGWNGGTVTHVYLLRDGVAAAEETYGRFG